MPTPATPAGDTGNGANGAIEKTETRKAQGQQWANPKWVEATAATLKIRRHVGEDDAGFRDRVYGGVEQRRRQAAANGNDRAKAPRGNGK